ncbi:MAG: hypothetical protein G3M78_15315 [Candidatus Nitrohelix vancouverensis]|uniref:Uncharacterized protein n=1 Tax=Candidatus Nitrohelix vancouverensis TaxID=2705534 RepID=A0A7T0C548_9BACT|nr:MAG: hypothetical protein G3M78_15315 [Candidatus Nitrohelix vancouverensis]
MTSNSLEFSPFMFIVLALSYLAISFSLGVMLHSSFMYEDKNGIKKESRKAWTLCMAAGAGVTGWMFYYGYFVNFGR